MVLTATALAMPIIVAVGHVYFFLHQREEKEIPLSMAIRKLVHGNNKK